MRGSKKETLAEAARVALKVGDPGYIPPKPEQLPPRLAKMGEELASFREKLLHIENALDRLEKRTRNLLKDFGETLKILTEDTYPATIQKLRPIAAKHLTRGN